jgi:hypothetical protein
MSKEQHISAASAKLPIYMVTKGDSKNLKQRHTKIARKKGKK